MTPPKKRSAARRSGRSTRGSGRPAAADPAAVDAALTESAKLLRAGRPDRAETLLRRAVKEQGFAPRICANLANALLAQGNAESAHKLLRLSAEANPDVAHPWHDLGVLAKTRGALDEARTALRRAVERDPRHGAAWRNLGTLLTRTDPDAPDLAAMRGALEMLPRTGAPTAELLFAIGRALEQTERFDEAFDAYAEGNRLRRSMVRHSRAGYEAMADSAIARFDADWHARGPVPGASDAAPILVVGMPRSGSTLVEQILSSHPDAEGVGEVEDLSRLIHGRVPDDRPPAEGVAVLGDDELASLGKRYAKGLAERAPAAKRVVDKYLANAFHGGLVRSRTRGSSTAPASRATTTSRASPRTSRPRSASCGTSARSRTRGRSSIACSSTSAPSRLRPCSTSPTRTSSTTRKPQRAGCWSTAGSSGTPRASRSTAPSAA